MNKNQPHLAYNMFGPAMAGTKEPEKYTIEVRKAGFGWTPKELVGYFQLSPDDTVADIDGQAARTTNWPDGSTRNYPETNLTM